MVISDIYDLMQKLQESVGIHNISLDVEDETEELQIGTVSEENLCTFVVLQKEELVGLSEEGLIERFKLEYNLHQTETFSHDVH